MQILKDYWLDEEDELIVHVKMDFLKVNGESQHKEIYWSNPNLKEIIDELGKKKIGTACVDEIVCFADVKIPTAKDICLEEEAEYLRSRKGNI